MNHFIRPEGRRGINGLAYHPDRHRTRETDISYQRELGDAATAGQVRAKDETSLIQSLIQAGSRDENDITNKLFFNRHPERRGKKINPIEAGFKALSAEWLYIRDRLVRPFLRSAGKDNADKTRFLKQMADMLPAIDANRGSIPREVILAWIKRESDGDNTEVSKLDERGYFQISPAESNTLGFSHDAISGSSFWSKWYSVRCGIALINAYAGKVRAFRFTESNPIFWRLVKLWHGASGVASDILKYVRRKVPSSNQWSWEDLRRYMLVDEWSGFAPLLARYKFKDPRAYVTNLFDGVDRTFAAVASFKT
jgi:hypothetical protein